MEQILLIGGGGHCKACIDVIELQGTYQINGIVDLPGRLGEMLFNYPIIGTDSDLARLLAATPNTLITLGFCRGSEQRRELYQHIRSCGGKPVIIVSPLAHVSAHAQLAEGVIIMHQALVNAGARIGANTIINSRALIEHDCVIGDHCHIATGAHINGNCDIGDSCLVGSGSVILPGCTITANTQIGAGAVVTRDIVTPGIYAGSPARPLHGRETP